MSNLENLKNRKKVKKPITNNLIYNTLFLDRVVLYAVSTLSLSATNFFYDSISNQNNANWSPKKKDLYMSYLSSAFNLGAFLGPVITIAFSRSNTKILLTVLRIFCVAGNFGFCATNNIIIMTFSKFLIGLSYMSIFIVLFWYQCHNLLPEQKVQIFNLNTTVGAACLALMSTLSLFDPGNRLYWRICHLLTTVPALLSIVLDFTVLSDINCVSYFTQNRDYESATKCLEEYLEPEIVAQMIEIEKDDIVDSLLEGSPRTGMMAQSTLSKLKENFQLLWQDLKTYRDQVLYMILIYILSMGGFFDILFNLSTYLGAKEMGNANAVKRTKSWSSIGFVFKMITGSIFSFSQFNKKRKLTLEMTHTAGLILMLGITASYFMKNLLLANICILFFYTISAPWYATFYLYPNEILKPSLTSISYMTLLLLDALLLLLIPNFIQFELSSFKQVGFKLLLLVFVGAGLNICLRWVLVETSDMKKTDSRKFSPLVESSSEELRSGND